MATYTLSPIVSCGFNSRHHLSSLGTGVGRVALAYTRLSNNYFLGIYPLGQIGFSPSITFILFAATQVKDFFTPLIFMIG